MNHGMNQNDRGGSARKIAALLASAGAVAACVAVSGVGRDAQTAGVQPSSVVNPDGTGDVPVFACFAPDGVATPEQIAAVQAIVDASLVDFRYNEIASWTGQGQGTTLSWSLVPDGLSIPSGVGEGTQTSTLFATMDAKFNNNRALWISLLDQSFQRWAEVSNNEYIFVTNGTDDWDDGANWGTGGNDSTRGDVRIGMKNLFNQQGGTLAYNGFPTSSDMVMDSNENWQSGGANFRFMRNIIIHEHGHGLGFAHICPVAGISLMEPLLNTSFDGPQHDDIRAVHRGYGDEYEPNDSIGIAADLGTLPSGITTPSTLPSPAGNFTSATSLDDNSDRDFYRINFAVPAELSVTVTPIGRTYDDSDQFSNGNCGSGNVIDSRQIHDLRLRLLDSGGSVILDVNDNGLGQNESFSSELVDAGEYFVQILAANSANFSQMYNLSFDVADAPECATDPECDDGDPSNGVEVCVDGACVTLPFPDCNDNGLDDDWEIANGVAEDCNENGIPDFCDLLDISFAASSGNLSPIGNGDPASYTFLGTPSATSDIELTFDAIGDFSSASEVVEVFIGGVSTGTIFNLSIGNDCTTSADTLTVSAADWNNARNPAGDVDVQLVAATSVSTTLCNPTPSRISVLAEYQANSSELDDNNNGIPDSCEVGGNICGPADVTTDGTSNGIPDDAVTLSDFSFYLSLWSAGDNAADLTTDGTSNGIPDNAVTLSDFSFYLGLWSAGCP